jgi:hypothetical protein
MSRLNAPLLVNIPCMSTALEVSQVSMAGLRAICRNICLKDMTREVCQDDKFPWNALQLSNIDVISVTEETSHEFRS